MIRVGCSRSTVRYTLGPVGSTLTNGFGTRKRRTPRRVLLPESGSTEIAARIGECVAPSCAHAVIVHSAVAINASGHLATAGEYLHAPVRAGMEEARAGAKPWQSYRDLRRRSSDPVPERQSQRCFAATARDHE